jgi:hypothetical protein
MSTPSPTTTDYGEPWKVCLDETMAPITNESGEIILNNCEIGEQELVRIGKCVNACTGIADPAEAIKAAREALESIPGTYVLPARTWIALNKALSLLTPKSD